MRANKKSIRISRGLRRRQTPHEAKLWYHLRGRRFKNYKFRRQVPIDNYIVDFYCHQAKMIIELDGGQHLDINMLEQDRSRDKILNKSGYKTIRIFNNDLDANLGGVLEIILKHLEYPHP